MGSGLWNQEDWNRGQAVKPKMLAVVAAASWVIGGLIFGVKQ